MIANLQFWDRYCCGISFCVASLKHIYCIINGVPKNFYENAATVTCCSCGAAISVSTRAGGRAVDLGGPSVHQGGQSLELSAKAAVFKRVSLLIGGSSIDWVGQAPPWRRPWFQLLLSGSGVDLGVADLFQQSF